MRILFVEDDEMIASGLEYALTREGYQVTRCGDLASAQKALYREVFSLGLLDLSLPDGSGYDICRQLRELQIPVVFLTAVDDEANVVMGLEMGADDYVTKPFRLQELMARIRNVMRRSGASPRQPVLPPSDHLRIHTLEGRVWRDGAELELTAQEYRLLLMLATHSGQILTRTQLLEAIWDSAGSFVNDNTLTVTVRRLREKIGDSGQKPGLIETVRGMGYRFNG